MRLLAHKDAHMETQYQQQQQPMGETSPLLSHRSPSTHIAEEEGTAWSAKKKKSKGIGIVGVIILTCVCIWLLLLEQRHGRTPSDPPLDVMTEPAASLSSNRTPPPLVYTSTHPSPPVVTLFEPFSSSDPRDIMFPGVTRQEGSSNGSPGSVFGALRGKHLPLPTNSWSQNLMYGDVLNGPNNKIDQIPYTVDTAGLLPGLRTHGSVVQATDKSVMTFFEPEDGMALGAVEDMDSLHTIVPFPAFGRLALTLQWNISEGATSSSLAGRMRSPIVRGCPYTTMEYTSLTPHIIVQRKLAARPVVDNTYGPDAPRLVCGVGRGNYSSTPVIVERELRLQFDTSDMTWLVFVSQPTEFECSDTPMPDPDLTAPPPPPGVAPTYPGETAMFELRATSPMKPAGVMRIALANNCSTGQSPNHCLDGKPRNQSVYEELLREHAELYPSGAANIQFAFYPREKEREETLSETVLHFNWKPVSMSSGNIARMAVDTDTPDGMVGRQNKNNSPIENHSTPPDVALVEAMAVASPSSRRLHGRSFREEEGQEEEESIGGQGLLMLALPHQQSSLLSSTVLNIGCMPTLHGTVCPVLGNAWDQYEVISDVQFGSLSPYKPSMLPDIRAALLQDLTYEIPLNYQKGAGDTYFSGKMLSKLARIIQVGTEVAALTRKRGTTDTTFSTDPTSTHSADDWIAEYETLHAAALARLRSGVEVWLNGSALSPLVFDDSWGGIVGCGCVFNGDTNGCDNQFPDCPALTDSGQNYGAGFYNDHHFHYGYHIYAAAVLTKNDPAWGVRYHEHVLCLIRDIANPSESDPFFPMWRHKDWYMGSSWASGVVTTDGNPPPNGRNQESSSEAIGAYEGIALYGLAALEAFRGNDSARNDAAAQIENCQHIYNMGKLLLSTEIRSAQEHSSATVHRIYPDVYAPKVVGMLWSFLAQEQTWFGGQEWASYGIQLMPLTPSGQYRDSLSWVQEMLPAFNSSCVSDDDCKAEGWSILVLACQATVGQWREAWTGLQQLDDVVFTTAGGNGHSRSNSLWWIATRPNV